MKQTIQRHAPATVAIVALLAYYAQDLSGGLWEDEVIYLKSGVSLLTGYPFVNPTHMHAPVGKVVFGVAQVAGNDVVGPRFASVVMGLLALVVVYYATVRVTESATAGVLGIVLLGTLPVFVYRVPIALLGSTLALTMALLVACSLRAARTGSVWWTRAAGASATLVGASKVQGGLWALAALGLFAHLHVSGRTQVRDFLLGVIVALPVVYAPFLGATAPAYYAGHTPPAFVHAFGEIPWIGAVGYAYGASLVTNLFHVAENPSGVSPLAYFWWIVREGGPFVVLALGGLGYWVLDDSRKTERRVFLWLLAPLAVMLVVPVRAKKNLVGVFVPLAVVAGVVFRDATRELELSTNGVRVAAATVVVLMVLLPPGGIWLSPNPAPDTAHDELYDRFRSESDLRIAYDSLIVFDWYNGNRRYDNYTTNYDRARGFDTDGDGAVNLVMWDPGKATHPRPDVCVNRSFHAPRRGEIYPARVPHVDPVLRYEVVTDCS
jgi:4-amino-4-deoxy-L-arabinose transferase-like glycosyltransferase